MRIGAFEVTEPVPELNDPYVFAILRPWIDVNNVGTLVLDELETQSGAEELARLFAASGFVNVGYRKFMFGTIGVHWGEKP